MRGKHLTQKEYDTIKALQKAGIKKADICRLLKVSYGVVNRAYATGSLESYKEKTKETNEKRHKKDIEDEVPQTIHEVFKKDEAVALLYKKDLEDIHVKLDLIIRLLNKRKVIF